MATLESQKRSERRRNQKSWERLNRDPEVIALRREMPGASGTEPGIHMRVNRA